MITQPTQRAAQGAAEAPRPQAPRADGAVPGRGRGHARRGAALGRSAEDGLLRPGRARRGLASARACRPRSRCVAVEGEALRGAGSLGSGSRLIGVWEQDARRCRCRIGPGGRRRLPARGRGPGQRRRGAALGARARPERRRAEPRHGRPFSPKAVRASMGAIFGQPVARASFDELRAGRPTARGSSRSRRGPAGRCARSISARRSSSASARSGSACPTRSSPRATRSATFPLRPDGAESLNVAMAATLCLYECRLHRLSSRP